MIILFDIEIDIKKIIYILEFPQGEFQLCWTSFSTSQEITIGLIIHGEKNSCLVWPYYHDVLKIKILFQLLTYKYRDQVKFERKEEKRQCHHKKFSIASSTSTAYALKKIIVTVNIREIFNTHFACAFPHIGLAVHAYQNDCKIEQQGIWENSRVTTIFYNPTVVRGMLNWTGVTSCCGASGSLTGTNLFRTFRSMGVECWEAPHWHWG